MKIKLSPEARKELLEAKKFYNLQQKGLGRIFVEDVKLLLQKIESNPFFASVRYDNIRAPMCKKFPFAIHYHIDTATKTIMITSVFHSSRNPFWLPGISDIGEE